MTFRAIAADDPNTNSSITNLTIKGQLIANAPTFTTTDYNISNRTLTTASASWAPTSWITNSNYNSPSIVSVIQEIVNQGTWASGNAIAIIITGTGHRSSPSYNGDATNAAKLVVTYTLPMTYYSKGSFAVNTPSSWNTARDGSGTNASSFGIGNTWVIQNAHSMTLSGSSTWDVSTTGTVQIENGGSWLNSSSGAVTIGTFQVDNGGTYSLSGSAAIPGTTRTLGANSTIDYAGTDQSVVALAYGNLTLSGSGTKTFAVGNYEYFW